MGFGCDDILKDLKLRVIPSSGLLSLSIYCCDKWTKLLTSSINLKTNIVSGGVYCEGSSAYAMISSVLILWSQCWYCQAQVHVLSLKSQSNSMPQSKFLIPERTGADTIILANYCQQSKECYFFHHKHFSYGIFRAGSSC